MSDPAVPNELLERREAKAAAERLWDKRLLEALDLFPFAPFGDRVVVLQRQADHKTKSGILLPQTRDAPLSGWVVATPKKDRFSGGFIVSRGDEVLFPDHAAYRITILIGLPGEEQKTQEFLVIDWKDLHGKVLGGHVDSFRDVVPGLDATEMPTGREIADATDSG